MNIYGESYMSGTGHDHRKDWFSLNDYVGVVNWKHMDKGEI